MPPAPVLITTGTRLLHLVDDGPRHLRALGLVELEHLAADRDAEAVNAGGEVELDEGAKAVLVDPPLVVEGRDENRKHALHGLGRHSSSAQFADRW